MSPEKCTVAASSTLLGSLQRGTGAGFLEALAASNGVSRAALEEAIRIDCRWDQQLDSRSWYYACLAQRLGISSGDVETLVLTRVNHDTHDSTDRVAVSVLAQLASWGDVSASRRLIDYVCYGDSLDIPVAWCDDDGTADNLARLHTSLGTRFPNRAAVFRELANLPDWSLDMLTYSLESLASRDDRFLKFSRLLESVKVSRVSTNSSSPSPAEAFSASMTFEEGCWEFLRQCRLRPREVTRWRRETLEWLHERFCSRHTDWLVELLLAEHSEFSAARLGDLATILPAGEWPAFTRRALADGRNGPRWAARELLVRTEQPEVELVQHCLRSALAANDMYSVCDALDMVKRCRLIDLMPDVTRAYRDATYSYGARHRAVEILTSLTPELFREQYARECLWDCEVAIIAIGCQHVSLDNLDVRARLEFLRKAFETDSDEVHQIACERLGH